LNKKLLTAAIAAVAVTFALPGTASAAPNTLYCLNGATTTLPVTVGYSGGSRTLTEELAGLIISFGGGTFYLGFNTAFGRTTFSVPSSGFAPETTYAPGFSTNFVGPAGVACAAGPPPVTNVAVCKALLRADGTLGAFQAIPVPVWNDSTGQYFDAPAANWVEGLGLTCDNPLALGYKAAGYSVSWGGKRAPDHDIKGLRGSGFNDIYPYFTK